MVGFLAVFVFFDMTSSLGTQHRRTISSASSLVMWGMSVRVASTCYSLRRVHWDRVNWEKTFPKPSKS